MAFQAMCRGEFPGPGYVEYVGFLADFRGEWWKGCRQVDDADGRLIDNRLS
jgi:hypothetical protein